jgi:hypothetical protein
VIGEPIAPKTDRRMLMQALESGLSALDRDQPDARA